MYTRANWILLLIALLVAPLSLTACGSDDAVTGDVRVDPTPREGYPTEPHGLTEGSVITNLSFLKDDGGAFSLQDIHADGGNRLLLVSTSAGWCTACIEEQPKLQALHDEFYDRGFTVMVSYFQDAQFQAATAANAAEWRSRFDLTFDVVADPDFVFESYYNADLTPMTMLVDVSTMKILHLETGFTESTIRAIIKSQL